MQVITAKQKFTAAYGAVRAAAQGRVVEEYVGQDVRFARVAVLECAAMHTIRSLRVGKESWGHDSNLDLQIADAACVAYADTKKAREKALCYRLDIFKREKGGEYIC